MKKIDLAICVGVITALISWGVSVEVRIAKEAEALNLSNRVRAMEELMLPILIDWKTHVEVKKWQEEIDAKTHAKEQEHQESRERSRQKQP